jgi:Tfp pilus assembly protein PilN
MVGKREILGIYLDEADFEVVCLRKGMGGWSPYKGPWGPPEAGRPLAEQLKGVLQTIRPSRRRGICLALPRKAIFLRELRFPQLEPEEAIDAVRLGIGLHAHLKPEEIYHDQWGYKRGDETVVLLAYLPKAFLDPLFRIVRETGHKKSLGPVAPAFLGFDIVLRRSSETVLPCVSLGLQGETWVASLHGVSGWEGSHPVVVPPGEGLPEALEGLFRYLPASFSRKGKDRLYVIGDASGITLNAVPRDLCRDSKKVSVLCGEHQRLSWGLCAASLGLSAFPVLCFQEGARRRPLRMRLKVRPYQALAGATAVVIILATGALGLQIQKRHQAIRGLETDVTQREKRLAPLLETRKELEQLQAQLKDLQEFATEQPPLLTVFRTLTQLTPSETWIKSLNFAGGRVRITAQGGSAVDVMGLWRNNKLFTEVKLVSPVTKYRQEERFSVELKLASGGGGD